MFKKCLVVCLAVLLYSCGSSNKVRTVTKNSKPVITVKKRQPVATNPSKPKSENKSEVLEATSKVGVTSEDVKNYITQYKDIAKDNMRQHGIPSKYYYGTGDFRIGSRYPEC